MLFYSKANNSITAFCLLAFVNLMLLACSDETRNEQFKLSDSTSTSVKMDVGGGATVEGDSSGLRYTLDDSTKSPVGAEIGTGLMGEGFFWKMEGKKVASINGQQRMDLNGPAKTVTLTGFWSGTLTLGEDGTIVGNMKHFGVSIPVRGFVTGESSSGESREVAIVGCNGKSNCGLAVAN